MRATDPRLIVLTIALLALPAQAAQGHGPCQCSFPEVGEAGTKVKTRSAAYKVIINPRAEDFLIGPSGIESAYRPEAPRKVLLSRPKTRPLRGPSVRVPAAMPPGLYLILIFDGSEGGVHYTWDYFHVLGREPGATGGDDEVLDTPALVFGLGGIAVGFLGFGLAWAYRRRLRQRG